MANKINFEVGFTTNSQGLKELKSELAEIRALASKDTSFGGDLSQIQAMVKSANDLEYALNAAFDVDLNTVNIQKFNQILKQSKTDLSQIQQNLAYAGTAGQSAFLKATAGLMQFNTAAKQTNKFLDDIARSFANTVRWGIMSSIVNNISSTIQKSYYYVKDLDSALNDIRIVTGKNADEMSRFAEEANNAAKSLAVTTEDYTQGSLIYYQQGLDDDTVKALTDITAKTSNVTGQSMSAVSEELTAVWNGYQVANEAAQEGMQVYEEYVDKMAAVGASTASDLQELATAMSKVASAASSMGVDFDDLNAQIATIVSVTRQAPESVGTALKTIYARLGDLKVDGVDEFGVKLGEVTSQLQTMGIQILDQNGDMRAMSDVMAEVAEKWNTWTEAQRQAAAVAMAGKRQYNNLVALFDNWDMYGDALKVSMEAAGTLEEQQEIALDSLANKMDTLKATAEDLYDSLYDEEDIKGLVEGLTNIVQGLADFSDSIGGLVNLLPMLGSTALRVFDNQIANAISTVITNSINFNKQQEMMKQNAEELKILYSDSSLFASDQVEGTNNPILEESVQELTSYYSEMKKYQNIMTEEQKKTYKYILDNIAKIGEMRLELEESTKSLVEQNKTWKNIINLEDQSEEGLKKRQADARALNTIIEKLSFQQQLGVFDTDNAEEVEKIFGDISGELDDLGKDKLNIVLNRFRDLNKGTVKIPNLMNSIIDKLKELGATEEEVQKLKHALDNTGTSTKNIRDSLSSGLNLEDVTKNITNTIGAIGQLTSGISTLQNIGSIFSNDELTIEDKLLQSLTNISMALPMIVSGYQQLNEVLKISNTLETLFGGIINAVKIKLGLQTAATEGATAAQWGLNAAMDANPIGVVILLVTALTGVIYGLVKAHEKHIEQIKEENNQTIEKADLLQEEIDKTEELYNVLQRENDVYEKTGKATDELKDSIEKLCEKYDIKISKLEDEADAYEEVIKKIKEKRIAELEEAKTEAEAARNAAVKNAELEQEEDNITRYESTDGNVNFKFTNATGVVDSEDENSVLAAEMKMEKEHFSSKFVKTNEETGEQFLSYNKNDLKETAEFYEELGSYISKAKKFEEIDPEYFNQVKNMAEGATEAVKKAAEEQDALLEKTAAYEAANVDYEDEDFEKNFENTVKNIAKTLKEAGASEEEAIELAIEAMSKENDLAKKLGEKTLIIQELKKDDKWSAFKDSDLKNIVDKYDKSEINALNNYLEEQKEKGIEINLTPANIDKFMDDIQKELADKTVHITLESSSKLMEGLQSGKINASNIGENEEYTQLVGSLKTLQKAYPEITSEVEVLNKTWLVGTQEYLEALEKVQDKAYELDLQQSIDEINKLIDDTKVVTIDADPSAFAEKMEEILNKEYEIDVKIHTEAEREFNSIETAFDDIHNKASLIGDDFIVAADKVRELNQTFPGILEGIKFIGDGTVKLNEDIVKSAMAAAEEEAKADAEATVSKLKDQAKLLRAKQSIYERMANLAFTLAKTETDSSQASTELQKEFSNALTELKEVNSKESADKELTHQKQVTDSSNTNANQLLTNWKSAFEGVATSSLKAAEAAIQNMNAISSEGKISVTQGDFSKVNYNGANGTSATAEDADSIETILKNTGESDAQKAWTKIGEQYAMLADEAGAAANDVEGMIVQIGAGGQKVDQALKGTASGLGSDGKKDKSSKSSQKEHKDDEVDRYWEINKALEKVTDALKKLDKLKSHVFGKQKIQVLQQEKKLIQEQTKLYEKLYEEQKKEAEELRGKLSAGGMTFSAEGEITNYGEALKSALASYNAAVDQFNAGLMNEEAFKVAEKNYENFKKNVDRYDKLFYTEMKNTRDQIEDEIQKLRDINLEQFEIKLQVKIDKETLKKEFREFRRELKKDFTLEYEILPDTKVFKKNFNNDKKNVQSYMKAMKDIQKEIDIIMAGGTSEMFASLTEAQEKLKEVNKDFEEASKTAMQDVEEAWENYIALIDQTNEKLEQQQERYEAVKDELEDWKQMIELVYGDKAYNEMNNYYKQAEYNSLSQIDATKKTADAWEAQFKAAFKAQGASMDHMDEWSEDLTKLYENWKKSEEDLRKATIEHINLIKEDYANAVNGVLDTLEKELTGGMGLEDMEKEWEQATKWADKYYNEVQKVYNIQTLNNKIQKSINEQSNVKNAQKLERLREKELNALREKKYMTEYDLKAAEARYDITLKEIALEDARNNKSTMKLSRNSEGNWSYQYVADETDIADKQQDLLDAVMKLQDLSVDQTKKLTEERNEAYKTYLAEVKYITDKAQKEHWTQEQLDEKLKTLENKYFNEDTGIITLINKEFNEAKKDAGESGLAVQALCYEQDKKNFAGIEKDKEELFKKANEALAKGYVDGFQTKYNDTNSEMKTNWEKFLNGDDGIYKTWDTTASKLGDRWNADDGKSVKDTVKTAIDGIKTKFGEYLTKLTELEKTSGIDFGKISKYMKDTGKETDNVNKNVETLLKKTSEINTQRKAVENLKKAWDKLAKSIDKASKSTEEYLKKKQDVGNNNNNDNVGVVPSGGSGVSAATTSSDKADSKASDVGWTDWRHNEVRYKYYIQNSAYSKAPGAYDFYKGSTKDSDLVYKGKTIEFFRKLYPDKKTYPILWRHNGGLTGYKTGGYTGSWSGSEGRLAELHQKELVLNAKDTENFLAATNSLRDIASLDSSIEKSIASAISKMLINMSMMGKANIGGNTNNNSSNNTNNTFNITAEFPNANDVTEIREAILSLPNLASQYVSRQRI